MTNKELNELFAKLALAQERTDAQIAATDKQLALSQERVDAQLAATDKQLAKTMATVDKVGKQLGGLANNQGDITEEFFITA